MSWTFYTPNPASSLVATTVAALSPVSNGAEGLIRAGSSPYEFVSVVYDSTYAKWVSPSMIIFDQGTVSASANATAETDLYSPAAVHPYGVLNTAGLIPQFRVIGNIGKNSAGANSDMSIMLSCATQAEGAVIGSTGAYGATFANVTKTITSTNILVYDSGWVQPTMPTAATTMAVRIRYNNTNAADAKVWNGIKVHLRWVG